MNYQDEVRLTKKYNLRHSEVLSVFRMVRTGNYTVDAAARFVIRNRKPEAKHETNNR